MKIILGGRKDIPGNSWFDFEFWLAGNEVQMKNTNGGEIYGFQIDDFLALARALEIVYVNNKTS